MSELNYIDTGFGSKLIDFTQAPFNNIDNQSTIEFGFGNKEFIDSEGIGVGDFNNSKSQNFGSKKVELSKKELKYEYEDIFERGSIRVNRNSFGEITIKNKLVSNPVISCTTSISGLSTDISINVERISTRKFRVFNPSNKNIEVNYIASFNNTKKTDIQHDQENIDRQNNIISNYFSSYITTIGPKFEEISTTKKVDLMNTSAAQNPEYTTSGGIELNINHELVIDRLLPGSYSIPSLGALNYFTFTTPANEDVSFPESSFLLSGFYINEIAILGSSSNSIYSVTESDDLSTNILMTNSSSSYPYKVALMPNTTYYFWYEENFENDRAGLGAWFYNTIRFPNVITYN